MSDQKREGTALAAGTALGLGIAAFLGVGLVLAYLLFRRQPSLDGAMLALPSPGGWSPPAQPQMPSLAAATTGGPVAAAARPAQQTIMRTYTLPSITTNTGAFRLATAPSDTHNRVTVRVIAPQGGLAVLAFAPNELVGLNALEGGTMVIPTGQHQDIRLPAGQSLYGKGHVPGVMVSIVQAAG